MELNKVDSRESCGGVGRRLGKARGAHRFNPRGWRRLHLTEGSRNESCRHATLTTLSLSPQRNGRDLALRIGTRAPGVDETHSGRCVFQLLQRINLLLRTRRDLVQPILLLYLNLPKMLYSGLLLVLGAAL